MTGYELLCLIVKRLKHTAGVSKLGQVFPETHGQHTHVKITVKGRRYFIIVKEDLS